MKNFTKVIVLLIVAAFLTLSSGQVMAQWNTNTAINLQISGLVTADMVPVPTSDGKMWVAFYHENAGNYDMRAQLIDADGYKLLGADGVLVSNQTSGSATYVFNACVDGSNNLIIGMQDMRSGDMQAVLYKISQTGTHLWSPNGVILGGGMVPNPAALTNGETVAAWNETTSNTLKIQKITAGGALAWATPVTVLVGTTTTTRGQIIANLNDKFTMVYQKSMGGISTNLYAQMFNGSGTALYAPLQIGNQTTAPYRYYSITSEADTTYFGYYSSTGFRFNSFLQRINPNGTIPWGMNGSSFNTSTGGTDNYQMETSIGLAPGSPYVWSVCNFCDPNQTIYGVYVQKFLKTSGARQFTDQGKIVYSLSANRDMHAGDICIVNDSPMFMSYQDDYKIFATRLDGSGNFAWPNNKVEISSTTAGAGNPKGRYGFATVGPNKCSGVWTEDRGSGELGYAQGISIGGLIGIDVTTLGGVPATITFGGGTLQLVATIFPATANQNVNWSINPVTGNASITTSGLVTGIADGTVWAKAVSVQDITMKDSILITISGQIPVVPTVVTLPATNITLHEATLNGSVNANYNNSSVSFEWGLTPAYGNSVNATPTQVTGGLPVSVLTNLATLASGTTYHFRCVATNVAGTTHGLDQSFVTDCQLPGSVGTISGPNNVCASSTGNVYTIAAITGATSYIWTLPVGAIATGGINSNTITVTYTNTAQSGNISVFGTDGTCYSISSDPYPVTVNPVPVQAGNISGTGVVCQGQQGVEYSIQPITYATGYVWSVPSGAEIISGQNTTSIIVNFGAGATSGNITVYGTNSCGSGNVSAPLYVDIAPLPGNAGAVTGPTQICAEASGITYSVATISNAYGYVWSLPPGCEITNGGSTNQITVHYAANATSGNISVYGTNGNCLGQPSASLFITVNPTPATPVITQHGDTLTSNATAGNQWYLDGTIIPGATGQKHIAVYKGTYTVKVTLNGCSSALSNGILVQPVSISDYPSNKVLEIFPNPNNGKFYIKALSSTETNCKLEIYNELGKIVWQKENLTINGNSNTAFELNEIPSGIYMVVLRSRDNSVFSKILITR